MRPRHGRNERPERDVIIVGAGPAGLSAALILGRCRRRVVVCDSGRPRNAAALAMHGFLTRDGIAPEELRRIAREQLRAYDTVEIRDVEVTSGHCIPGGFEVLLGDGTRLSARKLLLATGVVDELPQIEGIESFYGRSVHHCPYCDGWEWRDRPIAVYGKGRRGLKLAVRLTNWSRAITLCTDGPAGLRAEDYQLLTRIGVAVRKEPIVRLEGTDGLLERIVFRDGEPLASSALFFNTDQHPHARLAEALKSEFTDQGGPRVGAHESTTVPGLYVAGDASRNVQFAIVAAAEGATAAVGINSALLQEDLCLDRREAALSA
jgi:thioredoxin reductase